LNRNEAATIPVEAIHPGERVVCARRNIDTGGRCDVVIQHSECIRNVQGAIVLGERDSVGIIELPVQPQRGKRLGVRIETKNLIGQAICDKDIAGFTYHQVVKSMLCGIRRRKTHENFSTGVHM